MECSVCGENTNGWQNGIPICSECMKLEEETHEEEIEESEEGTE